MELIKKYFHELTTDELYEIMKLRVDVFVVEQNCAYHELDDIDKESIHVYLKDENVIHAYCRVIPKGLTFEHVSIGRVIAKERNKGLGSRIVQAGIRTAAEEFHADIIEIEAQTYARSLYEKQGFKQVSEEFLEDGIPHIKMKLEVK